MLKNSYFCLIILFFYPLDLRFHNKIRYKHRLKRNDVVIIKKIPIKSFRKDVKYIMPKMLLGTTKTHRHHIKRKRKRVPVKRLIKRHRHYNTLRFHKRKLKHTLTRKRKFKHILPRKRKLKKHYRSKFVKYVRK